MGTRLQQKASKHLNSEHEKYSVFVKQHRYLLNLALYNAFPLCRAKIVEKSLVTRDVSCPSAQNCHAGFYLFDKTFCVNTICDIRGKGEKSHLPG